MKFGRISLQFWAFIAVNRWGFEPVNSPKCALIKFIFVLLSSTY